MPKCAHERSLSSADTSLRRPSLLIALLAPAAPRALSPHSPALLLSALSRRKAGVPLQADENEPTSARAAAHAVTFATSLARSAADAVVSHHAAAVVGRNLTNAPREQSVRLKAEPLWRVLELVARSTVAAGVLAELQAAAAAESGVSQDMRAVASKVSGARLLACRLLSRTDLWEDCIRSVPHLTLLTSLDPRKSQLGWPTLCPAWRSALWPAGRGAARADIFRCGSRLPGL